MGQRVIAAAGEREDDVKMLPEKLLVEGGAGGREASAPMDGVPSVETPRGAHLVPVPSEPVLRLSQVANAAALAANWEPLRLTEIVPSPAPPAEEPDREWNGAALARAREARGLSLSALADCTKITRHHLENIEGDHYERLPSYVYLRGILLSIARELRIDGQRVCRSYMEHARRATGDLH